MLVARSQMPSPLPFNALTDILASAAAAAHVSLPPLEVITPALT